MEREELVKVTYDSSAGKITITGYTFEVVLEVSSSELSNVYWGSEGVGQAKLTIDKN